MKNITAIILLTITVSFGFSLEKNEYYGVVVEKLYAPSTRSTSVGTSIGQSGDLSTHLISSGRSERYLVLVKITKGTKEIIRSIEASPEMYGYLYPGDKVVVHYSWLAQFIKYKL